MSVRDIHSSTVSRTLLLFADVKPEPKQSTRFTLSGHAYTSAKKRKYLEKLVQEFLRGIQKGFTQFEGRLRVTVIYAFPWRKSDSKLSKNQSWAYMDKRPDVDNLFKPVGDALQTAGIIKDDGQIVEIRARKIRTAIHGIAVKVEQISEFI